MKEVSKNDWVILADYGVTPDNLSVGGYIYLADTGITSLPDNLSVGGSLYLEGSGITSLPDNLSVGGSLYLTDTGITSLPDNLSVGGDLYLRNTGITSLPDNLSVGGALDLRNTGITSIFFDERGYYLFFVATTGRPWIVAGCRKFRSVDAAIAHWGSPTYESANRGAQFVTAIQRAAVSK